MKAAQYSENGIPSKVVKLVDLESQPVLDDQVRIQLEVASINPADLLAIQGLYPIRPKLPGVPGSEGVGRIIEAGSSVTNVKVGDRVFHPFRAGIGTWQEEVVVPGKHVFTLPDEADPFQLAMASVNPPSAYFMLTKYVDLKPGDYIIQNAANSAVGQYVITFAKNLGLKTINIVRRESAVDSCKQLGGDFVFVDGNDLAKRVSKETNGVKIKIAFDAVAGESTHRLSQCLEFGGTLVNYGAMSLEKCALGASQTIFKQIKLVGLWLQKWTQMADPAEVKTLYETTSKYLVAGKVKAIVEKAYPLTEITQALDHAMKNERNGKILLTGPAYKQI